MEHVLRAKQIVLHLKATGEKFDDEEYVIHEIATALEAAHTAGYELRREGESRE